MVPGRAAAHIAWQTARPRGASGRAGSNRSRGDDRANFLLISGILLVTGVVLVSTAIVHTTTLERSTDREQRAELVYEVDGLVAAMDRAVNDYAVGGELDTDAFAELARAVEQAAHDHAARAGVFASVTLSPVPILDAVAGRCMGYDPENSKNGIVVGWERDTLEHGIVGVVYDLHISDGSRSLNFQHYVQIRPCADTTINTHMSGWSSKFGSVTEIFNSHRDDAAATLVSEEKSGLPIFLVVNPTLNESSFLEQQWQPAQNIKEPDGVVAHHSSNARNYIGFELDPPELMQPGDTMDNVQVKAVARLWQQTGNQPFPENKRLWLRVFAEKPADPQAESLHAVGVADMEFLMHPLPSSLTTFTFDVPNGPSGNPGWTYEEIQKSYWEFRAIGTHQSGWRWEIDYYYMEGGLWADPWRMNLTLDWPAIPHAYGQHELILKYKLQPGTVGETFLLEARDATDAEAQWFPIHTLSDTTGLPNEVREVRYTGDGWDFPFLPNRPEYRFTDSFRCDPPEEPDPATCDFRLPDRDTIQIQLMRMVSTLGEAS